MADKQQEPMTPMAEAAAGLHEMFKELLEQGFTQWQALRLLGVMLAEQSRQA